jgi:hypothetical protein
MGALIGVHATVRFGGIYLAFARLGKTDFRKVFKALRRPMRADQIAHRNAQRGPRGPWAPLAASTKERYAREGKRRNRRILARLPNARQTIVTADKLTMKNRVKWSGAHFRGPTRVGRGAVVPQRQFWWLSKPFMKEAKKEFKRALIERWRR